MIEVQGSSLMFAIFLIKTMSFHRHFRQRLWVRLVTKNCISFLVFSSSFTGIVQSCKKTVQKNEGKTFSNAFDKLFVIGNCQSGTECTALIMGYHSNPFVNLFRKSINGMILLARSTKIHE